MTYVETYVDSPVSLGGPRPFIEEAELVPTDLAGPGPHVLVCVHGIRDDCSWGSALKLDIQSGFDSSNIVVLPTRYDRVSSVGFIFGYKHKDNCADLLSQLHTIRSDFPYSPISIICHSNGTKVFADISAKLSFRMEWVFLCGCVCRVRDADKLLLRDRETVNDAGTLDWWPVVAESLRPSLFGATGVGGFHRHPVTDRWFRYYHGGAITLKHINEWVIPILVSGRIISVKPIEIGFKKQMPTIIRRCIILLSLAFAFICVKLGFAYVFIVFCVLIALSAYLIAVF